MESHQGPVVQNLTKMLANRMLKFLSWNMANTLIIFAANVNGFGIAKATHICSKKYQCVWKYLSFNSQQFVINQLAELMGL